MAVPISNSSQIAFLAENPEIEALWRINQIINSTLDLNEVLRRIISEVPVLLTAQSASVILHNEATEEAEIITTYGSGRTVRSLRYPLAGSLTEWVSIHKRPLRLLRLTEDEWPEVWRVGLRLGAAPDRISVLLVPLWRQGKVIGSIEVVWDPRHGVTDREERLLEVLAGQAASAITNAQLYWDKDHALQEAQQMKEALQEEARVAAGLAHVGQELIAALGLPTICDRLCQLVAETLESDRSTTAFLLPKRTGHRTVSTFGYPAEKIAVLQAVQSPQENFCRLLARLAEEEVVVVDRDALASPFLVSMFQQLGVRTVVFLALRHGQDLIGFQTVGYDRKTQLSRTQRRIAQGLSHLASLALEGSRLLEEAQSANRLKSEFLATMSHELRTPLNIILGYTDFLVEGELGQLNAKQLEALRHIDKSARGLLELVIAALDVGRLEAGRLPRELGEVDVSALMAELRAEAEILCRQAGLALTWLVAPELPTLFTDQIKLKVVLRNLLGNAKKFTREGGITVRVQPRDEGVEFRVTDTGIGIPPDVQAVMFEMFRQGDGPVKHSHEGVGLGLYIVKRFLEVLHGEVTVESDVGKGSTFCVWLPLALEERKDRPGG